MKTNVFFAILIPLALKSSAHTVGPFVNVTEGIWDEWNQDNPDNVKQDFGFQYGNDRLWLVSRRQHRPSLHVPWDSASRGGIVSTFRVSNKTWTHQPYGRLAEDEYGEKLFSLNDRLFMLTYSTSGRGVAYHKLFFWQHENGRWLETPLDIDPASMTLVSNASTTTSAIAHLSLSVPQQVGRTAYLVSSLHGYASGGSEMIYSSLQVEFRRNAPLKGKLRKIAHVQDTDPSAVFFTVLKEHQTLYGFVQHMYSEGYVAEYGYAYALDLNTNNVSKVDLGGNGPPMMFDDERMFQTRDELFIVGGVQVYGLGQVRDIKDIWTLSLNTLQWKDPRAKIPDGSGTVPAYDQQNAKLYLAGLKEGIKMAPLYR